MKPELYLVTAAVLLVCNACVHRNAEQSDLVLLRDSANWLDFVSNNSQTGIPDSVMNAAKCVITLPSPRKTDVDLEARGVASCRESSGWSGPTAVTFSGHVAGQTPGVLILFIMTDKAASRLGSGPIVIRGQHAKAPIVSIVQSNGLVTQFDLASDFLTYEADPKGAVGATQLTGTIRAEQSAQQTVSTASRQEKSFHAALQSFVDTIYPTGIVIHHTALVASEKLPTGEKEVDAYHQQRGFEIYCSGQSYHVAYHYLILPDGTVQRGRPERCEGRMRKDTTPTLEFR
jgi:hypothetical protein